MLSSQVYLNGNNYAVHKDQGIQKEDGDFLLIFHEGAPMD